MAWGVPKIGTVATPVASGNLTLTEPAGIASGDLMVACIAYRSNAAFTVPGDWNLIATQQSSGDTDATNGIASLVMMWTVRGGSAPTLTFNRTAGDVALGLIIAYTGGHASTPYDTGSSNTLATASTINSTTTITTAEAGELLVSMSSAGDTLDATNFTAVTNPNGGSGIVTDTTTAPTNNTWFRRVNSTTGTGADSGLAVADAIRETAGATGTVRATLAASARHAFAVAAFKLGTPSVNLAGTSAGVGTSNAAIDVTRPLAGASAGIATAQAVLGVTKNLAGTSAGVATAQAALTNELPALIFAGTTAGVGTAAASINVTKNLVLSSAGVATAAAILGLTKNLIATSAGIGVANADVKITKNLAAASAGIATAAISLSVVEAGEVTFAGTSAGVAAASAVLNITRNFVASSAGTSTVAARVLLTHSLAGTSAGVGIASAALNLTAAGETNFAGTSAGVGTAAANLGLTRNLFASSAGSSTAAAAFGITRNLAGTTAGVAMASATLNLVAAGVVSFAGSSAGIATISTSLSITRTFAGTSSGAATAVSLLSITRNLQALSAGTSNASINLSAGAADQPGEVTIAVGAENALDVVYASANGISASSNAYLPGSFSVSALNGASGSASRANSISVSVGVV